MITSITTTIDTHAPSVNFEIAMINVTINVEIAPTALMTMLRRQPGSCSFW